MFPPDLHFELKYSGAWQPITGGALSGVRAKQDVIITRGQQDESSKPNPSTMKLQLNNRNGRYSPRNPRSDLYGLIGRNTPMRVRVGDKDVWFYLPGAKGAYASTPDSAVLDITGDMDIRIDLEPDTWRPDNFRVMASKYTFTGSEQRSWGFNLLASGALEYTWRPEGLPRLVLVSTATIPEDSGRLTVRVTLDADDGAGNHVVTFYTAPSMTGPWTQLGDPIVTAGTASVAVTTSELAVGGWDNGRFSIEGTVFAFEFRNGIDGVVVASPDFTVQEAGDTTFVDSSALPWTVHGSAAFGDRSVRYSGEVSEWPPRWDLSGSDVWVPIAASGIRRRLSQGASPLSSALYRGITGGNITAPVAYWPCEDEAGSTSFASAVGHEPMRVLGDTRAVKPAAFSGIASSLAIPKVSTGGRFQGTIPAYPESVYMRSMMLVSVPDAGVSSEQNVMRTRTTGGTTEAWNLRVLPDGALRLICFAHGGATVVDSIGGFAMNGASGLLWIYLIQNGADVDWQVGFAAVDSGDIGILNATLAGHSFGRAHQVVIGQNYDLNDVAVGHVHVLDTEEFYDIVQFARAWNGDSATDRAVRLAAEEGIPLTLDSGGTASVGPQRPQAFLDLVDEAADADIATVTDRRDSLTLHFRPRVRRYNQTPALALDYKTGEVSAPFEPQEDDQNLRNDITVQRTNGSSARFIQETGPLSILTPPDGVGRYDESITINVETDAQLPDQAGWRLHLGTVDELRYPSLTVDLAANPHLIDAATRLDVGDRITVANPPDWLPGDTIDLIVLGYQEVLNTHKWQITFNCSPGSPWNVWVLEDPDYSRLDTSYSETTVPFVAGTDTALSVCSGRFEGFEDTNTLPTVSSTWERTQTDAHTGTWSLYSGVVGDSGTSDAVFTVPEGATHFRFWYRVSSESGFDFFRFLIDGVEQFNASGEVVWTQSPVFDVAVGSELTFRYAKDSSVSAGSDAAWVDDLTFTNGVLWETDPALTQVPFDIHAGGVRLRVTAITNETSPQIFTVDQVPINGVTMTIPRGASVQLATPAILAL